MVIAALTLGYTDELSQEIKQSFSVSGGSHVLSVKWLTRRDNLFGIRIFLRFMDRKPTLIIKQIIILISLWYYTFICGLARPSFARAIMISLICISDIVNRKSVTHNAVFFFGILYVIYNLLCFRCWFSIKLHIVLSILFFFRRCCTNDLITVNNKVLDWLWSLTWFLSRHK